MLKVKPSWNSIFKLVLKIQWCGPFKEKLLSRSFTWYEGQVFCVKVMVQNVIFVTSIHAEEIKMRVYYNKA